MKTINIKGKPYVLVNERIMYFRDQEAFEGWRIETEIVSFDADNVLMKASVVDTEGNIVATGHAQEYADSSFINKTSYVENCETSAIGRALALMGIGIEQSVASADEVVTAITQQKDERPWLNHATFNEAVKGMNTYKEKDDRQKAYDSMDKTYKMKKDYRKQLLEIVEQQDITL